MKLSEAKAAKPSAEARERVQSEAETASNVLAPTWVRKRKTLKVVAKKG